MPAGHLTEFRKSFDREKSLPCLKIYCNRLILFIKLYPVAEKDIIWFGEVIDALNCLKKPKEIKLEAAEITDDPDYELKMEYDRILNGSGKWRYTEANRDYSLCPSYSQLIPIPESINDTVLMHASRYRVQNRFPLLANIYEGNALIRSGQPLSGLTQKRCVQDEKLIEAIKQHSNLENMNNKKMMIIDARPSTSALANTFIGAGIERLEYYEGSERVYLNLENIHTIRESHDRLSQQIKGAKGQKTVWIEMEEGCAWLDHLKGILEGVGRIVEALKSAHVLVHCSDGWDRTSQLISLTQLCLFPEYRTRQGFKLLIKKDWLSTGHRFSDRNNHHFRVALISRLTSAAVTKNPWNSLKTFLEIDSNSDTNSPSATDPFNSEHECPIFLQFIEATVQLCRQFPLHFMELTDDFLIEIVDEAYAGNVQSEFFGNCEAERLKAKNNERNEQRCNDDPNITIVPDENVIIPYTERSKMILWPAYYKRFYQ